MKRFFSVLLVMALCLCLSSCGTTGTVNKLLKAINNHEIQSATQIYQEKILGNSEAERTLESELVNLINTNYQDYNNGKTSYEDVMQDLETISETELLDFFNVLEAVLELEELKASKDAYIEAESFRVEENYLDAYRHYGEVIETDTLYDTAQENQQSVKTAYLQSAFAEAQKSADQGLFDVAYDILETTLFHFAEEPEVIKALDDIEVIWVNSILAQAESLGDDKEFQQAFLLLTEAQAEIPDGSVLDAQIISVLGQWKAIVVEEAVNAFGDTKDYEAAIRVLQLSGLPAEEVDAELAYYQSFAPVSLTSLEYTKKAKYVSVGTSASNAKDVVGNIYSEEDIICPYGGFLASDVAGTEDEAYVSYYLNQEYTTLSGTLYRPYSSLSCEYTWEGGSRFRIYGDGILLYEGPSFSQETYDPVSFSVDVTGVRELKITIAGVWADDTGWIGMYSRHPRICAANLVLQK